MKQEELFEAQRTHLFAIAYRMLGTVMDAEDMVQEAYLRWQWVVSEEVDSPKAYLSTVITRLCIDHLRSAKVQRESYVGPWLPEPLIIETAPDVAEHVALAESLSMAFLILLESLNPTERATFLLHEIFGYDYHEISQIVGKSEANCRQIARRARQHINSQRPRFEPSPQKQQELMQQFFHACNEGDMPTLLNLLSDDITAWSDGGGRIPAARKPIYGPDKVSRYLLSMFKKLLPLTAYRPAVVNGQPAVLIYQEGAPYCVTIFEVGEGKIQSVRTVVNPEKLRHVPPLS